MRFYRDPLLHFAVAGALLFVGYALMNRGETDPPSTKPVHIGNGEVRWLKETFANQWQRTPTDDEEFEWVGGESKRNCWRVKPRHWVSIRTTQSFAESWRRS